MKKKKPIKRSAKNLKSVKKPAKAAKKSAAKKKKRKTGLGRFTLLRKKREMPFIPVFGQSTDPSNGWCETFGAYSCWDDTCVSCVYTC